MFYGKLYFANYGFKFKRPIYFLLRKGPLTGDNLFFREITALRRSCSTVAVINLLPVSKHILRSQNPYQVVNYKDRNCKEASSISLWTPLNPQWLLRTFVSMCVYIWLMNFKLKSFQFFQAIEFFLLFMEKVATIKYPSSVHGLSLKRILQEKGGAVTLLEFC